MTLTEDRILNHAMSQAGAPYIWQAKGDIIWTPGTPALNPFGPSFDCSGLVTWAMWKSGNKDMRLTHNAQMLFNELVPTSSGTEAEAKPVLCFYGKSPTGITHVALGFSLYGEAYVVEAAGGDSTTTTIAEAKKRGARVRVGPAIRGDFVGSRRLPVF